MLNNKGQSLVLFVLLLPIMLGVMALVIDVGNALNKKNEMENSIEFVIDYGLKMESLNKNELDLLLNYNLSDCENILNIEEDKIIISSKTYVEGIFTNILNIKGFPIESSFEGYLNERKKEIIKLK